MTKPLRALLGCAPHHPHPTNMTVLSVTPSPSRSKHRALLIGISYSQRPNDIIPTFCPPPLEGPVNDAKEFKKTLIEVYQFREDDISIMTDEEVNKDTARWASKENILKAASNLVHDASPGDAFVFFYTGHSGSNDQHEYLLTCDVRKIFDNILRRRLVDPLPTGARLTVILDTPRSRNPLDLDPYYLPRRRRQSLSERRKPVVVHNELKRRNSDIIENPWLVHNATHHHMTLPVSDSDLLAIVRIKFLLANESKQGEYVTGWPTVPSRRHNLGSSSPCAMLNGGPLVISVSVSWTSVRAWEDSKRKGKRMTVKLIKTLRKDPSITRVRKARGAFRTLGEKVPPTRRTRLERKYKAQGLFDFREDTVEIRSSRPLRLDEQFIL
ncbi:caspase domain-containing protein [Russula earlei]|uniref:Caspase domain-containing protein n=1 Tax=Russula earlei TaxID=71964 RepID=A0ACC0UK73_9AGAM|nr:caspase domain-containing protein [Russula earlei]